MTESETIRDEPSYRVLLLDDEPDIRFATQKLLAEYGLTTEVARDGREGLQLLLQRDYDVAVVDVFMDGMDGLTFLEEAIQICPWLGVVVITGDSQPATCARVAALGPFEVIFKPLNYNDLQCEIRRQAERKRLYLEASQNKPLLRLQYQISVLRGICETAVDLATFSDIIRHLAISLARLFPNNVMSIFGTDNGSNVLIHDVNQPISPDYLNSVDAIIAERHRILSGQELVEGLTIESVEGDEQVHDTNPDVVQSVVSVPIIHDGLVTGLICLTSAQENAYDSTTRFLLYHAANHLSMVVTTFNRLQQLATVDSLTGLYNRRRLEEELSAAVDLSRRYGHAVSVVFLDIDNFKSVNDTHGHLIGDRLLREVADGLGQASRVSDFLGRIGGDEFVAILRQSDLQATIQYAGRLVRHVSDTIFCEPELKLRVTVSAGIATNENRQAEVLDIQLLEEADKALYKAKENGRNRFEIHDVSQTPAHV